MSRLISRLRPLALALCLGLGAALAGTPGAVAQEPEEFKQIELTDELVTAFLAAQKDFQPLAAKLAEAETLDAELTKELDGVAKKHGFANFAAFEDVGANITLVLDGLDRKTGNFTDPKELMQKELEELKADDSIPAEDKKLAIEDLTQEIAATPPLKFTSNIELVKKHIKEIEALIPDEPEGFDDDDDGDDS